MPKFFPGFGLRRRRLPGKRDDAGALCFDAAKMDFSASTWIFAETGAILPAILRKAVEFCDVLCCRSAAERR